MINSVTWTAACTECPGFYFTSDAAARDTLAGNHSAMTGHVVETGFQLP